MQANRATDGCGIPDRCRTCVIRQAGVCGVLTAAEVARLSRIAHHRTFEPGQVIMQSEEKPTFWAGVLTGVVKITKLLVDGRQQIVDLLFPSDFVGRPFSKQTPYFAEAATRTELCCFRAADFEAMLKDHPGMKQQMLENTLDKLDTAHDWMIMLGRKTAEERVASLLYHLVTRAGLARISELTMTVPTVELHLKREEMASFLGLTYETVIRQIKALDGQGIITLSRRREFSVPDLEALRLAGG
ncbi:MAG: Crp/Fnr family transcriptional regulator [Hyphomicrobiaceae bacterium]|nr:Crp/Fnr family transcriptional regulator [Hyphomicrobiaceae bacterium]